MGPLLGGYIASIFGLRIPLFGQAILMAASLTVIVLALPESRWRETSSESRRRGVGVTRESPLPAAQPQRGALWRLIFSPAFIFVGLFALMIVANRQGARLSVMPLFGRQKGFGPDDLGLWLSVTHFPTVLYHPVFRLSVRPLRTQDSHSAIHHIAVPGHRRLRVGPATCGNCCYREFCSAWAKVWAARPAPCSSRTSLPPVWRA